VVYFDLHILFCIYQRYFLDAFFYTLVISGIYFFSHYQIYVEIFTECVYYFQIVVNYLELRHDTYSLKEILVYTVIV